MRGFYVWDLTERALDLLLDLSIDFIWANKGNKQYLEKLKDAGVKIFYPLAVFSSQNKDEAKKYAAIDKSGKKIKTYAGWYNGLCPSNPALRKQRLSRIKQIFSSDLYDGIYLDSIRYPTYWETKQPEYLDTCYCATCRKLFQQQTNLSWNDFRIHQIRTFVEQAYQLKEDKLLGYFAVPATGENLRAAFAQPAAAFSKLADYVSPMLYPQMVHKNLSWVQSVIKYFQNEFPVAKVIPLIQVVKLPQDSADQLTQEATLKLAQTVSAAGHHLAFFMLDQIIEQPCFVRKLLGAS